MESHQEHQNGDNYIPVNNCEEDFVDSDIDENVNLNLERSKFAEEKKVSDIITAIKYIKQDDNSL